jgi:hypothetical protein
MERRRASVTMPMTAKPNIATVEPPSDTFTLTLIAERPSSALYSPVPLAIQLRRTRHHSDEFVGFGFRKHVLAI